MNVMLILLRQVVGWQAFWVVSGLNKAPHRLNRLTESITVRLGGVGAELTCKQREPRLLLF